MRQFLRLQFGLLAVYLLAFLNEWNSSAAAKWQTLNKWTNPEAVPTSSTDAIFIAAKSGECKVEGNREARALSMTGYTGTFNIVAAAVLRIGGSTAPKGEAQEAPANVALKLAGTLAGPGQLKLVGSVTSTPQTIDTGGKSIPWPVIFEEGGGKYKLETNLTQTTGSPNTFEISKGTLEVNGKTLTLDQIVLGGTGAIDLTASTLKVTGGEVGGVGYTNTGSGAVTTSAATVIELGDATHATPKFGGAGKTYKGTFKINGREAKLDHGEGQTLEAVEVLNKGTTEKGIQFKQGATTTFTTLAFNGTSEERCRCESNEAAKQWKLKGPGDYEPANSYVAVKDCKYEGGTLYLPNGKDEGGNTGIKFEAKSSGSTTVEIKGLLKLAGSATPSVAGSPIVTGLVRFTPAATPRTAVKPTITGQFRFTPTAAARIAATPSITGQVRFSGTAASSQAVHPTVTGMVRFPATVTATAVSALRPTITGTLRLSGTLTPQQATTPTVTGRVLFTVHAAVRLSPLATPSARVVFTNQNATTAAIENHIETVGSYDR
jgi:hypothetical protein